MQQVSILQEYFPKDWSGLTTKNHLGTIFGDQVQDAIKTTNLIYQVNYGMDLDSFLGQFQPLYLDSDDDFRWRLMGHTDKNVPLVSCLINGSAISSTSQAGRAGARFNLRFSEPWFSAPSVIVGEKNELYPIRIVSGPIEAGSYFDYECELLTGDANLYIPYDELVAGKRFSYEYTPAEQTLSKEGSSPVYTSPFSMRNQFTMLRMSDKRPGNMISRPVAWSWVVPEGSGTKTMSTWMQYADWELYRQFRNQKNRYTMFGTSNRTQDNTYRQFGSSGNVLQVGAGLRQQMSQSNVFYYNAFDIDMFTDILVDLSVGKVAEDNRHIMVRTGEYGMIQFSKALEKYAKLYTPLMDTNRVYMTGKNTMGFKGQFLEYMGPNGIKVSIMRESMYDDPARNKILHPSGKGFAESYTYDIFSVGTINGEPNIRKVYQKGMDMIMGYIPGLRDPYTPKLERKMMASPVDGYEIHLATNCGAMIIDPTKTARLVSNVLA